MIIWLMIKQSDWKNLKIITDEKNIKTFREIYNFQADKRKDRKL